MQKEIYQQALEKISPYLHRTPLVTHEAINKIAGHRVYFKCENLQVTGSFKIRGCLNKLIHATKEPRITRSSGNFGQALAWAGATLQIPTTVIMPNTAPLIKQQTARDLGATVVLSGPTHREGYALLDEICRETGATPISAYDDLEVIAGQGTIIIEILHDFPDIQHILLPVGGGSLAAGCANVVKLCRPQIETIAVEPTAANDYFCSHTTGIHTEMLSRETIADGLRTPCVGKNNWLLMQKYVDNSITVDDEQIIEAMRLLHEHLQLVVEPSGAIALGALLSGTWHPKGDTLCILSGGNVDPSKFYQWIQNEATCYAVQ